MRACGDHWRMLRRAVDDRGMLHLVSKTSDEAAGKTLRWLEDTVETAETFDPLLNAYFVIVGTMLKRGATYLMGCDAEGRPYCPLCEVDRANDTFGASAFWVNSACNLQLARARELGLMPGVQ